MWQYGLILVAILLPAYGYVLVYVGDSWGMAGQTRKWAYLASLTVFALFIASGAFGMFELIANAPLHYVLTLLAVSNAVGAIIITEMLRGVFATSTTWTPVRHRNIALAIWVVW